MKDYSFYRYSRKEFRHALKRADPTIFTDSIQYLSDDPTTFRSGYLKELIWKYIKRYPLAHQDIQKLEQAVLNAYLTRFMSREFKFMCQTMSIIATPDFWQMIQKELNSNNPITQINAYCLDAYAGGMLAGEKRRLYLKTIHREISHDFMRHYNFEDMFIRIEVLDGLVNNPDNWINQHIVTQLPQTSDLPILYYYGVTRRDQQLVELRLESLNRDRVLPRLQQILMKGQLHTFTQTTWMYIFYIFYRMRTPASISIITEFLREKIDWKIYDSVSKGIMLTAVCKVLQVIDTQEALQLYDKYKSNASSLGGWLTFSEKQ